MHALSWPERPDHDDPVWHRLLAEVAAGAGDPVAALALADRVGAAVPRPGHGATLTGWARWADLGATDLTACRALEPHVDALTILDQAGQAGHAPVPRGPGEPPGQSRTWGVFAAEGPGTRLRARPGGTGEPLVLDGVKPWCSLAGVVTHALVTAWTSATDRTLCAVALDHPGVRVQDRPWAARGLTAIRSGPVSFEAVPAHPVGGPGWYLTRPGFAWGGAGVAACWLGGAAGLVRRLAGQADRREPDQLALTAIGECDAALLAAAAVLAATAAQVDAGGLQGEHAWARVTRVRHIVHEAATKVLGLVQESLGPGPLTQEEEYARRLADLQVYLRQHAGARDAAGVGRAVLAGAPTVWGHR